MKFKLASLRLLALAGGVLLLAAASFQAADAGKPAVSPARFTADGELIRPRDYRTWVYVGAPLTPNDMNEGAAAFPEFHSVYIDRDSYEHYKRTGQWREGAVIVKELISVGSKQAASGQGYFMGDYLGVEAMVKSRERFPDEPGNWAFFSFTSLNREPPKKQTVRMPTAQCAQCHQASAKENLVFTQHYPVLRAAKGVGTENPENRW